MIDLQRALRAYIPSLFEVLEDTQISWVSVSKAFEKNHKKRLAKMPPGEQTMRVEASFYDLISAALKRNMQAIRQLDFFDKLFQEIGMRLSIQQKKYLKTTVFDILISTDANYLHFFGQLAVLNQTIQSGNFIFNQTEFDLGNGKKADFHFHDIVNERPILVEVVNIILKKEISEKDEEIKKFLTKRLNDKIADKTKSIALVESFQLIPVIWGPVKDLQRLSLFYIMGNTVDVPNCLEACAYCSFASLDNRYIHKFGRLSTLFSDN